jgi:hypothetical protein
MTKEKFVLPFTVEFKYGKIRFKAEAPTEARLYLLDALTSRLEGGKPIVRKTKKSLSDAQRNALSKRMKQMWAAKRRAKNAAS